MLTAERLRSLLDYDPATGVFLWRVRRGPSALAGSIAGHIIAGGYRLIGVDGTEYYAHRLAWLYVHGAWPTGHIDHQNVTPGDDRISNLREATRSQNLANRPAQSNNTSGLKGVSFHKGAGRWRATIQHKYLGLFDTAEEAHAAYRAAASRVFGEFARAA